jgi:hypothetical protein
LVPFTTQTVTEPIAGPPGTLGAAVPEAPGIAGAVYTAPFAGKSMEMVGPCATASGAVAKRPATTSGAMRENIFSCTLRAGGGNETESTVSASSTNLERLVIRSMSFMPFSFQGE